MSISQDPHKKQPLPSPDVLGAHTDTALTTMAVPLRTNDAQAHEQRGALTFNALRKRG